MEQMYQNGSKIDYDPTPFLIAFLAARDEAALRRLFFQLQ